MTTIDQWREGDAANIETDLIGKYVARFLRREPEQANETEKGVSWELLAKSGFID